MELIDLLTRRYSARAYRKEAVSAAKLSTILTAAQRTPSWCNTQPWQVVVTATPAATDRFREALWQYVSAGNMPKPDYPFPVKYVEPHRERRKQCGADLYRSIGIPKEDKRGAMQQTLKNFRFFEAPHVMLVFCHESLGFYGGVDCGLYLQTFMLAALEQGVDSVPQAALATYPGFIRGYFNVPEDKKLLFGCSFGYADESSAINQFRTQRADLTENVQLITK